MLSFCILVIIVFLGIVSLLFKQNRDSKHIFNVIGWTFFVIIVFAAMVVVKMVGLG
jgi:hypothetical protein